MFVARKILSRHEHLFISYHRNYETVQVNNRESRFSSFWTHQHEHTFMEAIRQQNKKRETKRAREAQRPVVASLHPLRRLSRLEPWLRPADPGVDLADAGHSLRLRGVAVEHRVRVSHHFRDGGHDAEELLLVLVAQRGEILVALVLVALRDGHVVAAVIRVRGVRALQRDNLVANDVHIGTFERPAIVHVVAALGQVGRVAAVDVYLADDCARVGAVVEQIGDGRVAVRLEGLAGLFGLQFLDVDRYDGVDLGGLTASGDGADRGQGQGGGDDETRDAQSDLPLSFLG